MRLDKLWLLLIECEFEAPYPLWLHSNSLKAILVLWPLAELKLGAIVNTLPLEGVLQAIFLKLCALDGHLLDQKRVSCLLINLLVQVLR